MHKLFDKNAFIYLKRGDAFYKNAIMPFDR